MPNEYLYLHCKACFNQRPEDQTPEQWARLSVGLFDGVLDIDCVRCKKPITQLQVRTPRR